MAKIGVILSGCGVLDGGEIHESTLCLLALEKEGAEVIIMAPSIEQRKVVNHFTTQESAEARNVLIESARIARGKIKNIKDVSASSLDGVIIPGGYGAALNLSNYALAGADFTIEPSVKELLTEVHSQGKPLAAFCIAPPILAKVLKERGITGAKITIGNDPEVASNIEKLGQKHIPCEATDCVVDEKHKIVTTPAYMLAKNIFELWQGIEKTVKSFLLFTINK